MDITRVTVVIDAAIAADDRDGEGLASQIRAGLTVGSLDPDLVLWLLDGATVRAHVTR